MMEKIVDQDGFRRVSINPAVACYPTSGFTNQTMPFARLFEGAIRVGGSKLVHLVMGYYVSTINCSKN